MKDFSVYILHSAYLNRFYIGMSNNVLIRLDFHLNPSESRKFTAKANDWTIFLKIDNLSKIQAANIEKHIKSMKSKIYIQNLLKYPEIIEKLVIKFQLTNISYFTHSFQITLRT
jgi:putative endonuclease